MASLNLLLVARVGWWWKPVRVDRLISDLVPILVEELEGLLKQSWRRRTLGHGALKDVETVFVHMNCGVCTRTILICELQLMPLNQVRIVVREMRDLGVSLQEIPCR